MALQRVNLATIQQLPSTVGTLLTNAAGIKTYVRGIALYNGNTTPEVVQLYNVPNSAGSVGTAVAANRIYKITLAADESIELALQYPRTLTGTNDTIQGNSTTASKVNIEFLGDKE